MTTDFHPPRLMISLVLAPVEANMVAQIVEAHPRGAGPAASGLGQDESIKIFLPMVPLTRCSSTMGRQHAARVKVSLAV